MAHPGLGLAVGGEVGQDHVLVRLTVHAGDQPLEQVLIGDAVPEANLQLVQHAAQHRVALVEQVGVVGVAQVLHLIGMKAEEEHIVVAQQVVHFHVGTVQGADGQRAVHHKLHIAGAAGLLAGGGDLLTDLAGGHEDLGQGDAVVLQEHHLEPIFAQRVAVDLVGQRIDEVDDALGHGVAGGGLGAEQERLGR